MTFCNLLGQAGKELADITAAASYPKGTTLFVEGQPPRGVFILCSGHVKLSTSSAVGRTLILRIAGASEILGLPATVTGKPYELTAGVFDLTQANFIRRQDFLNFFHRSSSCPAHLLELSKQAGLFEVRDGWPLICSWSFLDVMPNKATGSCRFLRKAHDDR